MSPKPYRVRGADPYHVDVPMPEPEYVRTCWCERCEKESRVLEVPNHRAPWMRCCGHPLVRSAA